MLINAAMRGSLILLLLVGALGEAPASGATMKGKPATAVKLGKKSENSSSKSGADEEMKKLCACVHRDGKKVCHCMSEQTKKVLNITVPKKTTTHKPATTTKPASQATVKTTPKVQYQSIAKSRKVTTTLTASPKKSATTTNAPTKLNKKSTATTKAAASATTQRPSTTTKTTTHRPTTTTTHRHTTHKVATTTEITTTEVTTTTTTHRHTTHKTTTTTTTEAMEDTTTRSVPSRKRALRSPKQSTKQALHDHKVAKAAKAAAAQHPHTYFGEATKQQHETPAAAPKKMWNNPQWITPEEHKKNQMAMEGHQPKTSSHHQDEHQSASTTQHTEAHAISHKAMAKKMKAEKKIKANEDWVDAKAMSRESRGLLKEVDSARREIIKGETLVGGTRLE